MEQSHAIPENDEAYSIQHPYFITVPIHYIFHLINLVVMVALTCISLFGMVKSGVLLKIWGPTLILLMMKYFLHSLRRAIWYTGATTSKPWEALTWFCIKTIQGTFSRNHSTAV
jgi:hypothetical protein